MHVSFSFLASDVSMNQFFTIVAPLLFAYAVISNLLGDKVQDQLIKLDVHEKEYIKFRPYGACKSVLIVALLCFCAVYFLVTSTTASAVLTFLILIGYVWIRLDSAYCIALQYTQKYIYLTRWGKKQRIPMQEISKITWETGRHSVGYILVLYLWNGRKIYLSSADFVGLRKLKSVFESSYYNDSQF